MSAPALDLSSLLANEIANQVNMYIPYDSQYSIDKLKKINFVLAANGVFRVEKTPVALFKTLVAPIAKPIPGLQSMTEGPELLIPKIPFHLIQMALSFYLDVYDKDKTEASLLFFWNKDNRTLPKHYSDDTEIKGLYTEGQFVVYVPRQVNSSGLSEFHMDPMVDYLREKFVPLCESHSHHTMDAFFSGTDDANENSTQFYFVWGKIKNPEPQIAFRYVSGEAKVRIDPRVLFEWPTIQTKKNVTVTSSVEGFESKQYTEEEETLYRGPYPQVTYPAEWLEQHKKKAGTAYHKQAAHSNHYLYDHKQQTFDFDETEFLEDLYPEFYEKELDFRERNEIHLQSRGKTYFHMEDAEIIRFFEPSDELVKNDVMDNIRDLSVEYGQLDYDRVIEEAIAAAYKK